MLKSAMEREREAVDSENQMRIPIDFLRTLMVYESVANKRHPYSNFLCGNKT
jgi:secreted Zn-dependent insulinase-like peptidase